MKSERRHELKQNKLAQYGANVIQEIQPYWQYIAGAVVVLATVVFVVGFSSKSRQKALQAGWTEFLEAVADRDPDALSRVAMNHAGNSVGLWAQHASAQAKLIEACSAIYLDRAAAREGFNDAKDGFEAVLSQTTETLLRQQSLFGLARAYEGLNELAQARETYGKLLESASPDSALGKQAQRRIDSLNQPQTQDFYAWFFAQEPPPPQLPASGDVPGLPFGQPPGEPNISFPAFPQSSDLDIDFEAPLDNAAESSDAEIFDTLGTDADSEGGAEGGAEGADEN